jgi:hypothetical protein
MKLPFVIVGRGYLTRLEDDLKKTETALGAERIANVRLDGWNRRLNHEAAPLRRKVTELEQVLANLPSELARPRARFQDVTAQLAAALDEVERLRRAANPAPGVPLEPAAPTASPDDTVQMTKVSPLGSGYWQTQKQMAEKAAAVAHRQSA